MNPRIDKTSFGSITIADETYEHDVVIRLNGKVKKRKKKLSKAMCGTSHVVSLDEAGHVYREGEERLIVGTGQNGVVKLSGEAADYFSERECEVVLLLTPEAVQVWDAAEGAVIGLSTSRAELTWRAIGTSHGPDPKRGGRRRRQRRAFGE